MPGIKTTRLSRAAAYQAGILYQWRANARANGKHVVIIWRQQRRGINAKASLAHKTLRAASIMRIGAA